MKGKSVVYAVSAFILTLGLLLTLYGGWRAGAVTHAALHGQTESNMARWHDTADAIAHSLPPRMQALYRLCGTVYNWIQEKAPDSEIESGAFATRDF